MTVQLCCGFLVWEAVVQFDASSLCAWGDPFRQAQGRHSARW
jgi:hypothetical protein